MFKSCSTACPVIMLCNALAEFRSACNVRVQDLSAEASWLSGCWLTNAANSWACLPRSLPTCTTGSLQASQIKHSMPCLRWGNGKPAMLGTRNAATFLGTNALPEVTCQAFRYGNGSYWISDGFLCRAEWHEWAQKPDEVDDDYAMRIRMTFTFSVEGVPAHLRQKDFHTDGRSAAKQGAFSIFLPAPLGGSQQRGMSCQQAPEQHGCINFPPHEDVPTQLRQKNHHTPTGAALLSRVRSLTPYHILFLRAMP